MEFAQYRGSPLSGIPGDLLLDPATDDIQSESSRPQSVTEEVIEMFDMAVADDIDYPEIYSRQRSAHHSDDRAAMADRIRDARRIVSLHPEINEDSIDISVDEGGKLGVAFRLKTGESVFFVK